MGYIILQSDDSADFISATKKLGETGVCEFDMVLPGARVRLLVFNIYAY